MKIRKFRESGILNTILFWLTLLLVFCFGVYLNICSQPLPTFQGTLSYNDSQWKFGEKGKTLYSAELSDKQLFLPGTVYVLTTDLSYDGSGDPFPSAFVTTDNLEVEAYFHGESVFRNNNEDKIFTEIQSIGDSSFSVSVGKNCQGKNFRLELRNPMDHPVYIRLPGVTFGDHEAQIRHVFIRSLTSILISCAITFAVIVLVILGNTLDGTQWRYIYFALFAVLIVMYRAMQDLFVLYFWGNPFMAVLCEHFSIVACPIPLLMSFRYRLKPYYQMEINFLIGVSLLNLVVQLLLHFTGIRDVIDMMFITHIWLLAAAVSMVFVGTAVKKEANEKQVLSKLIPIVVGAFLDMLHYYYHRYISTSQEFYSTSNLVGIGLLISLFLIIWEARKDRIDGAREAERNSILEKMAYTDALTGIDNRAAFTKALTSIASGKLAGKQVLVVSADLNGLKQTNDNMGHLAGDRLIRLAAKALSDSLRPYGTVYRTGGDEFFALLEGVDESDWKRLKESLHRKLDSIGEKENISLSIALGAASLTEGDINRAIQLSDQRMYEEKERQHFAAESI